MGFLETLDGSGKEPREVQVEYFQHLREKMPKVTLHGMSGPPGIGKSFIARTIQRTIPNTAIVTTNNLLVDQYCNTYAELNGLKGKDYYEELPEYYAARAAAELQPTVFNPLSFYYFYLRRPHLPRPSTVIIDEAHSIGDMLLMTISKAFPCKYYGIPPNITEEQFLGWMDTMIAKLTPITRLRNPTVRQERLISRFENLYLLHAYLKDHLDQVKISYELREDYRGREQLYLVTQPLTLPSALLRTIFGAKTRLILLSGTLTRFHMDELFPEETYDLKEFEPLAPRENRVIHHRALPKSRRRDLEVQAREIAQLYTRHDRPNTLVHVTYHDAPLLAEQLKKVDSQLPVITHTKDTKNQQLAKFKEHGGILLASGMAEGVDLPGDLCRLIIIPRLLFPNMGDSAVKKRLALPGGQKWYNMTTMMTTIQQIGRGVRGESDWCHTYVLDYLFSNLVRETKDYLTEGFKESIEWRS